MAEQVGNQPRKPQRVHRTPNVAEIGVLDQYLLIALVRVRVRDGFELNGAPGWEVGVLWRATRLKGDRGLSRTLCRSGRGHR